MVKKQLVYLKQNVIRIDGIKSVTWSVKANYVFLIESIKKVPSSKISLNIFKDVLAKMQTFPDRSVHNKMRFVLERNSRIKALEWLILRFLKLIHMIVKNSFPFTNC